MKEAELISKVQATFRRTKGADLLVPNGDDGAVFSAADQVVISADVAVEGVHFDLNWSSYREIGRKITAANLADICAMGGWPEYLLVTVVLAERHLPGVLELAEGIASEADLVGAEVIGGDISKGNELSISITALGQTKRPIRRSGAKVGERVLVSSLPGYSAAGLHLLKTESNLDTDLKRAAVSIHKAPVLEYSKFQSAFSKLSSAIDISDGLLVDAGHIANASGVCIELTSEPLRESPLKEIDDARFLQWILTGGEDHLLLGTASEPIEGFVEVGRVSAGSGIKLDGQAITVAGYSHDWPS